jgi:hypothetical protein
MSRITENPPGAIRDQFWAKAGRLPDSEAEWAEQQLSFLVASVAA